MMNWTTEPLHSVSFCIHFSETTSSVAWRNMSGCCLVTMRSWVEVLETTSCRNAGKDYIHNTQSDWTLRKQKLRALGCPL
jgi:hypothetical protein